MSAETVYTTDDLDLIADELLAADPLEQTEPLPLAGPSSSEAEAMEDRLDAALIAAAVNMRARLSTCPRIRRGCAEPSAPRHRQRIRTPSPRVAAKPRPPRWLAITARLAPSLLPVSRRAANPADGAYMAESCWSMAGRPQSIVLTHSQRDVPPRGGRVGWKSKPPSGSPPTWPTTAP